METDGLYELNTNLSSDKQKNKYLCRQKTVIIRINNGFTMWNNNNAIIKITKE